MIGQTISHYKILSKLGQGGMGVVYKATDTSLERTVALKFLAPHLLEDDVHKARFVQEAKAAAALDHPNICTIHEIDEADGKAFLAMAYLDGSTVSEKVKERPLKLDEALDIALQAGEGLQAAHEKGIVHRDVKSSNLMLTKDGRVQIMDFGLAYLADRTRLTKSETVLGTPGYMSPEQAQRQPLDRRTDIWSLGVVVYEMVTGRLPFEGEREQAVLYAITNEEPEPITALRARVPLELDRIVGKAMAKSPEERYPHIDDMLVDLRELEKKSVSGKSTVLRHQPSAEPRQAVSDPAVPRSKHLLLQFLLALAGVALLVLAFVHFSETPPEQRQRLLRKFAFVPPETASYAAISPNGKHIAFIAGDRLWIQDLTREDPRVIEETEGAAGPFWSPESEFVGFAVGRELKRVSVTGGPVITLCEMPGGGRVASFSGTWSPDGSSIVFRPPTATDRLLEVPARGGTTEQLISETSKLFFTPHFLPLGAGERVLLFAIGDLRESEIVLHNLRTDERQVLAAGFAPFYSPSGHILYQSSKDEAGVLFALPFSLETLETIDEPIPIARNASFPSAAGDGTLLYLDSVRANQKQLAWCDRGGNKLGQIGQPQRNIFVPSLSPDGRFVGFLSNGHDHDRPDHLALPHRRKARRGRDGCGLPGRRYETAPRGRLEVPSG